MRGPTPPQLSALAGECSGPSPSDRSPLRTDRPACPGLAGRCTCPSLSGSVRIFPREDWSEPEDFGRQLESIAFFFPLKAVLSDSMRNFIFYFFAMGKSNVNMALMLSVFVLFPHRPAAVPAPNLLAGISPPPHPPWEPGRSHRLRKGSQGGDRRRGTRQARVGGGLELITSV